MVGEIGLTGAKIDGLRLPKMGQEEHVDKVIRGLRVRVGAGGAKTYILRKRVAGKMRNITLGRHTHRFGLADARRKARNLLVDLEMGGDPTTIMASLRPVAGVDGSLNQLVEQYLKNVVIGQKRSAREIERTFRKYILPVLGERLAETITRSDVSKLVESVAFEGPRKTPRMARIVHQQLSSFYTWAMPKLDHLPYNPCRDAWRPKQAKARDRVLNDIELGALWSAAKNEGWPFGYAVQLLILTAQRRSEVIEARWEEFDLPNGVWTIPKERAKNGRANIVPLSSAALDTILNVQLKNSKAKPKDFLFPSTSSFPTVISGVSKAWKRMVEDVRNALDVDVEHFTIHDIRRTVATGLQRLGVPLVVSEAVLNHQSGSSRSGVAGIYHRHHFTNEKRDALVEWSNLLRSIVG